MNDIKGKWSKKQLNDIWLDYTKNKMDKNRFDQNILLGWDLTQKAPCPDCGKPMSRTQFQGFQPDSFGSWEIKFIDNNQNNIDNSNLLPIHPWCN